MDTTTFDDIPEDVIERLIAEGAEAADADQEELDPREVGLALAELRESELLREIHELGAELADARSTIVALRVERAVLRRLIAEQDERLQGTRAAIAALEPLLPDPDRGA